MKKIIMSLGLVTLILLFGVSLTTCGGLNSGTIILVNNSTKTFQHHIGLWRSNNTVVAQPDINDIGPAGTYTFTKVPSGSYFLRVYASSYTSNDSPVFSVDAKKTTWVSFTGTGSGWVF